MKQSSNGPQGSPPPAAISQKAAVGPASTPQPAGSAEVEPRRSTVAKVSHTLSLALAERLEEFAFFQRVSESAVIEHSLSSFFEQSSDDAYLGEILRRGGAGRRRKP